MRPFFRFFAQKDTPKRTLFLLKNCQKGAKKGRFLPKKDKKIFGAKNGVKKGRFFPKKDTKKVLQKCQKKVSFFSFFLPKKYPQKGRFLGQQGVKKYPKKGRFSTKKDKKIFRRLRRRKDTLKRTFFGKKGHSVSFFPQNLK